VRHVLLSILILIGTDAFATVERVAICNTVVKSNFRNHARATITEADITILKSRKGYVLNEDGQRRVTDFSNPELLDLSMRCTFQSDGKHSLCHETINHLEMGLNYKSGNAVRVFATYYKNSGRLHMTSETVEGSTSRPLADIILQCEPIR
jgi:hypothetical protein